MSLTTPDALANVIIPTSYCKFSSYNKAANWARLSFNFCNFISFSVSSLLLSKLKKIIKDKHSSFTIMIHSFKSIQFCYYLTPKLIPHLMLSKKSNQLFLANRVQFCYYLTPKLIPHLMLSKKSNQLFLANRVQFCYYLTPKLIPHLMLSKKSNRLFLAKRVDAHLAQIVCDKDGVVDWCIILVEMPLTRFEEYWPLLIESLLELP